MNTPIILRFSETPPSLNGSGGLRRMHFRQYGKARGEWILRILEAREPYRKLPIIESCIVIYTVKSVQWIDKDNLGASFKILGDGLVHTGILQSDDPSVLRLFYPRQIRVEHRKEQGCEVVLLPISPEASEIAMLSQVIHWLGGKELRDRAGRQYLRQFNMWI